jgi:hypothetical protein
VIARIDTKWLWSGQVFIPEKSHVAPTQPEAFNFHVDERSDERKDFEAKKIEKELQMSLQKRQQEQQRLVRRLHDVLTAFRNKRLFKWRRCEKLWTPRQTKYLPINSLRCDSPVAILMPKPKRSTKALTEPQTPVFQTSRRNRTAAGAGPR